MAWMKTPEDANSVKPGWYWCKTKLRVPFMLIEVFKRQDEMRYSYFETMQSSSKLAADHIPWLWGPVEAPPRNAPE